MGHVERVLGANNVGLIHFGGVGVRNHGVRCVGPGKFRYRLSRFAKRAGSLVKKYFHVIPWPAKRLLSYVRAEKGHRKP